MLEENSGVAEATW